MTFTTNFHRKVNAATRAFSSITRHQNLDYPCWPGLALNPLARFSAIAYAVEPNRE
jgi:hypothetical protein